MMLASKHSQFQMLFHRSLKSIIAESYGPVGQAKLIGYTTAGYSIGAIAGPTIGGVLASPCDALLTGSVLCAQGAWLQDRCGAAQHHCSLYYNQVKTDDHAGWGYWFLDAALQ